MSKVVLTKCENYNFDIVLDRVKYVLDQLGGINNLIKENQKVFIKLNCVGPFDPSMGITTHPEFVRAVIRLVKQRTPNILIGDNPATKDIIYTLKKCGLYNIIQEEGITVFNGQVSAFIENPTSNNYSKFEVSKEIIDADVLINLPKLKTHSLTYVTCAQKNLFGFIYGLSKAAWHVRANNPLEFCDALNDLYGAILNEFENKQMIHLCDGIIGLEGEGPSTGGNSIEAKVILASLDAISLDRIAVEVMGLDYSKYILNIIASKRSYGIGNLEDITILGDSLETFKDLKFKEPVNPLSIFGLRLLRYKFIRNLILEHPVIDTNLCIKCRECVKICPPKTMVIKKNSYPGLTNNQCIRCWCCAEVCPQNAIKKSKRPLIGRLALKNRF